MKLKANTEPIALLRAAQNCKGEVIFTTDEGDRLNLKSTLSSYVFCVAIGSPEIAENGRVECSEPEDVELLKEFLEEI